MKKSTGCWLTRNTGRYCLWLVCSSLSFSALAGGGATAVATPPATEWTQLLNYGQLLKNTASQAAQVAQAVNAEIQRAQMLINEATNLASAPAAMISQLVSPYQQIVSQATTVLNNLNALQTSYQQAVALVQQRYAEARALGTNPAQYIGLESGLASAKQGQYLAMYQRDKAILQDVQSKSAALQGMVANGNLQSAGTVEGLDKLNAMLAMVAGETLTLNQQIAEAEAAKNLQQANDSSVQQSKAAAADALKQARAQSATTQVQETQQLIDSAAQPSGYNQQQIERQAWAAQGY